MTLQRQLPGDRGRRPIRAPGDKPPMSRPGLPLATFPEACPWSTEQVLDEDFWPEA